ncbi:hypothetical protein HKCCE2091_14490 [Rhodobacterales bacterium HKCCE2091]|nr:hypothetical protein [Rhodobacterales bacterium HKCCE2091]
MRKFLVFLMFNLATATAALAQDGFGPADVVPSERVPDLARCLTAPASEASTDCFSGEGIPEGARRFSEAMERDTALGFPAILTGVTEAGPVDLASAIIPRISPSEPQAVLVNGASGVEIVLERVFAPEPPRTPGTNSILARSPGAAEQSRARIAAYRVLPGGGQRFVVHDTVTERCLNCPPLGVSVTYLDYLRGRLVGVEQLGWFDPVPASEEIAARLEAADIRVLQARLNQLGYPAGPVDGAAGRMTLAAFYDLKADHCLDRDPRMRPVIPVLARTTADLQGAPCADAISERPPAPDAAADAAPPAAETPADVVPQPADTPAAATATVALPLLAGIYASDPSLCPAAGAQDASLVGIAPGMVSRLGESCTVVDVSGEWPDLAIALDCGTGAGVADFEITMTGPDGFIHDGLGFALCTP